MNTITKQITMEMISCPKCGDDFPKKRKELGYHVCVNCSTVGAKKGVPVQMGQGDHTWTETVIMEDEDFFKHVILAANPKTGKSKAEYVDFDMEDDRNLQGPFNIIDTE